MRTAGLGAIILCLCGSPTIAAESAADAIKAFGLTGTWSIDCARDPLAPCDKTGCGARTTYELPPSGAPTIKNVIGTLSGGGVRNFETTIEQATRIADDKLSLTSVQQTSSGVQFAWWRQPGERWQIVLQKVGDKYRVYRAQREDGKKISAEDGFEVGPPPGTKFDEMPVRWIRSGNQTPLFAKCSGNVTAM